MIGNRESDVAAFLATPRANAYPAVLVGAIWVIGGSIAFLRLATWIGKWAMLGPLLVLLALQLALIPFSAGRGALWTFGKGSSPFAQVVFCAFWIAVISIVLAVVIP